LIDIDIKKISIYSIDIDINIDIIYLLNSNLHCDRMQKIIFKSIILPLHDINYITAVLNCDSI